MADSQPDADMAAPTPRWVKMFAAIAVLVLVAFVVLHLLGGGPGRHVSP